MKIKVEVATLEEISIVSEILEEVANWLIEKGMPLWTLQEVSAEAIRSDVISGLYFLAQCDGKNCGTIKYQTEDKVHWPEANDGEAAYVHKIAVRRAYSGGEISIPLLQWATEKARNEGYKYLRLDCDSSRTSLRHIYERFGFEYHSEKQVGPYHVARYQLQL